jgi:hypothetical protein
MSMMKALKGLTCFGCTLLAGCGASLDDQTREHGAVLAAPSRDDFPEVADALQPSCATLDCHGQVGRNLRIYGVGGLRLSPTDSPGGDPTTDLEYLASYDSLVSLEPEALSQVITQQAYPNQLSIVRKTRGIEHHKGGQRARIGDALDRCMVLWLMGHFDPEPCLEVAEATHPEIE